MGTIVLYICLACTALAVLIRPWIGVVAAYVFVILTPQAIWWWSFEGVRPVLWTLVPTLIGIIALLLLGGLNFARLKTRLNLFLLILWICFIVSSFAGPYVDVVSDYRWFKVEWERTLLMRNILPALFCRHSSYDSEKKLKYLALVMVVWTIYLVYWCNNQYLSHLQFGRIKGPADPVGAAYTPMRMTSPCCL